MKKVITIVIIVAFCALLYPLSKYGYDFDASKTGNKTFDPEIHANLTKHVKTLSSDIGERNAQNYKNLEASANYIKASFESLNYKVNFLPYAENNTTFNNIEAVNPDKANDKPIVIIGAHYDTFKTPGADDNASGIAGVLELARLLKGISSNYQFKFVAFVNEEEPYFLKASMGSEVYAKNVSREKQNLDLVLILEMIGCFSEKLFSQQYYAFTGLSSPNKGNFILFNHKNINEQSIKKFSTEFNSHSFVPILGANNDAPVAVYADDYPFFTRGYRTMIFSDTISRNKYYHTQYDTYEKLNYEYMASLIEGISKSLYKIYGK